MKDNEVKLVLQGLDCANCANKIEKRVNDLDDVKEAILNFTSLTLSIEVNNEDKKEEVVKKTKEIVNILEPHVKVLNKVVKIKKPVNMCTDCGDDHEHKHNSHESHKGHNHVDSHKGYSHEGHSHEDHSNEEEHDHSGHDHHGHDHSKPVSLKDNISLIIGVVVYLIAVLFKDVNIVAPILFVISYLLIGGEIVLIAIKNIGRGEIFDENFLMTVATVGAFAIGEYPEAVAVMLFYQIGELFQSYAVNKSRKSITSLMDIKAEYANVLVNEKEVKLSPEEVNIDDIIIIKPGERVPLDGIVISGESFVDTSALTGESIPRKLRAEDEILAGCILNNGVLKVKVTKEFSESTVARILELVENASNKKAPTEKFISKFARYYTPIVVFSALALAIIPPILIKDAAFGDWIYRALVFLVVSCPCALVVSIPLGLFAGIGGASKKGVLIKGGNYLEALKDTKTVIFDKTGTLTKGIFKVTEVNIVDENVNRDEFIKVTAIAESMSNHPIAKSIINEYGKEINPKDLENYEEISGHGIKAKIKGKEVLAGNEKLMKMFNIEHKNTDSIGTVVHVAIDSSYKGSIVISDEVKEESKAAIEGLKKIGVNNIVMLTGDNKSSAIKVAKTLGIDNVYYELLPEDKVNKLEEIMKNDNSGKVVFVGDGINDAPVLARADIGIAMGGIGSDAAIEAADVVLMKDDPISIIDAVLGARKTNKVLWQNIVFSLGVKLIVLILGAFGIANMWTAVFADVGVTVIAVINSTRCLK